MLIRPAEPADWPTIWGMLQPVMRAGETLALPRDADEATVRAYWSSPEKTYQFDPVAGWADTERAKFMGVQACIWSEPMTDRAVFDRLVFPRLSAVAETGWTAAENKDFERFCAAVNLMPNLYGQREGA